MRVGEPIPTAGFSLGDMETLSAKVHQAMEDLYYGNSSRDARAGSDVPVRMAERNLP
jgi:hypothetical protein